MAGKNRGRPPLPEEMRADFGKKKLTIRVLPETVEFFASLSAKEQVTYGEILDFIVRGLGKSAMVL